MAQRERVPVVQNGRTKVVFDPPVSVRRGEKLHLQVFAGYGPLTVSFSNRDEDHRLATYLWCPRPADSCFHERGSTT